VWDSANGRAKSQPPRRKRKNFSKVMQKGIDETLIIYKLVV